MDPHYGAAWAWAGNTPFQWGKQVGSHLGGTRNPLVAALARPHPRRRRAALPVRARHRRRAHDPRRRRHPGARDRRRHRPGADARHLVRRVADRRRRAEHRTQQYFETIGNRGMYKDGWWLAMKTERIPWVLTPGRAQAVRAGRLGSGCRARRAVLPARRLHAGEGPRRRPPREGPGAQGAVLGGGRALQGPAAARDAVDVLRHAAADPGGDDVRVPRRRPERDVRA